MKKLMAVALLFSVLTAWSQGFEGTFKWSMKMDITDPKMKAEMEKNQKEMNSPSRQKDMKEMEEKMNDPQMKAMMEANPQMKAQMENAMKMMKGGGMSSMMPKGFTVKMKGGNTLTIMEGSMAQEILHQKDKDQSVRLDRENKTYSVLPAYSGSENAKTPPVAPKVTKTSETAKIINYNCVKYLVETMVDGKPAKQAVWTTTDIKDIDTKGMARQRMGQGMSLFYEGIEGVPLKMEMSMKEGNMVMEVMDMKRESLNAADFTIPSDFKEVKMQGMN